MLPAPPLAVAVEARKVDGLDLIETPEQTYARVHGSCDFRDSKEPSPLDKVEDVVNIVVDLRDPQQLSSSEGWGRRDAPAPFAALVKRLAKRDAELEACTAGLPPPTKPINAGTVVDLRLVPQPGGKPSLSVELGPNPDTPVGRCLAQRLGVLLRDVRIERALRLSIIVSDAAYGPRPGPSAMLDKDVIRRVIHRNISGVRQCYEDAMQVWPRIKGTVAVRFAIDSSDGHMLDARVVADDTGQPALACCIARTVYGWLFPGTGAKGFTVVTYPFILEQRAVASE